MYTVLPPFDLLKAEGRNIRLHGNRFIQIDVGNRGRVHVFSDIIPAAQERPCPHHDHNYGFNSTVLAGELINTLYRIAHTITLPTPDSHYPFTPVETLNDRCFDIYHVDDLHGILLPTDKAAILKVEDFRYYRRGVSYRVWRKQIHATSYIGQAITCITPETKSDSPIRVFVPHGVAPDNEFRRDKYPPQMLWEVVKTVYSSINHAQ